MATKYYGVENDLGGFTFAASRETMERFHASEPYWPYHTRGRSKIVVMEVEPDFSHPHFLEFNTPIFKEYPEEV